MDPMNDPANEDYSEVECCRQCQLLIAPGTEVEWNEHFFHPNCVPLHVLYGREDEQRANEAQNK